MFHSARALAAVGLVWAVATATEASDTGVTAPGPGDGAEIVNGLPTNLQPTTGALLFVGPDTKNQFLDCSGVLIGCRTVLTAAHCICPEADNYAECLDAISNPDDVADLRFFFQHSGIHHVRDIYVDPTYIAGYGGDLAILRLSELVTGIEPQPYHKTEPLHPSHGTPGVIVGFGNSGDTRTDAAIKRVGEITTAQCPLDAGPPGAINICWNFEEPILNPGEESSLCLKDDGGPLLIDFGNGPEVAGIHSGGGPTCEADTFSYSTDVSRSRAWITSQGGPDVLRDQCSEYGEVGEPWVSVFGATGRLPRSEDEARYTFNIPEDPLLVRVTVNGDTARDGDYDMYVSLGGKLPTKDQSDCESEGVGQFGVCEFEEPETDRVNVLLRHFKPDQDRGRSRFQITVTVYTEIPPHPLTPPRGPDNLRYKRREENWKTFTWFDDSTDEDGFELQRHEGTDPASLFVTRKIIRKNLESTPERVPEGEVFTYRIRAFNVAGNSEWSNLCYVNQPRVTRPTRLRATEVLPRRVFLKWRDNSNNEVLFELQRRKAGQINWKTVTLIGANQTEHTDTNLDGNTDYEYRIRARGRLDECIKHSRFSNKLEVSTPPQ
jgi:hypothetical protein